MSKRIIIGGGSGLIGSAFKNVMLSNGHKVGVVSRKPKSSDDMSWDTIRHSGLPDDVNVVINLAGRSIGEVDPRYLLSGPNKAYMDEVVSSRLETTEMLVKAAQPLNKLETFIGGSGIGFYPPDPETIFTEAFGFKQANFMTDLVHRWEEAAKKLDRPDVRQYQMRTGVVLARNSNFIKSLYPSHRLGLGGPIGNGRQWISWIHLTDVVNALDFLVNPPPVSNSSDKNSSPSPVPSGPVNVTSPYPARQASLSKALMQALGAPRLPFAPYPTPPLLFKAMLGADRSTLVLEGQRAVPEKLLKAGFTFHYGRLEQALEELYKKRVDPVLVD